MAKNKWHARSHWTYEENRGWLIERGIVAFHWSNSQGFHWSILLRKTREKWNVLWETPKSFRVDPEVFPKKKGAKYPVRKKARKIISLTLPVTSLPIIICDDLTSGDTTSGDLISGDVTAPTHNSSSNTRPIQHDILLMYIVILH